MGRRSGWVWFRSVFGIPGQRFHGATECVELKPRVVAGERLGNYWRTYGEGGKEKRVEEGNPGKRKNNQNTSQLPRRWCLPGEKSQLCFLPTAAPGFRGLHWHNSPAWARGSWLTGAKIAGRIEVVAPLRNVVHFQAEIRFLFSSKQPVSPLKQLIPNHLQANRASDGR